MLNLMFNLIVSKRSFIRIPNFFCCYIHKRSVEELKPLSKKDSSSSFSYLLNKLSLKSAFSTSGKSNTADNHDLVTHTLKSYNFTNAQIKTVLIKYSKSWSADVIKRKLDYCLSLGYSHIQLGKLVSKNPALLMTSLEDRVKPNVKILKSFLGSDQQIVKVVNRYSRLLQYDFTSSCFLPNIKTLEFYGVSHINISKLISLNPRVLTIDSVKFTKIVKSIKDIGFSPSSAIFVRAINVMSGLNPLSWDKKVGVYKSLGMSEKDVISAFLKIPQVMALSEDKIRSGMDIYVKEMNWDCSFVAAHPVLLCYSLEKRVIPRCSVMSILATKGYIEKYPSKGYTFLLISDKMFLDKYVIKYKDHVPEVLDMFKYKVKS